MAQKKRLDDQIAELRQMLNPGAAPAAAAPAPVKRKRRLSAAGRKAIADAARKRWAAVKAAQAEPAPTPAKAARKRASSKASAKKAATRKRTATKTPATSPSRQGGPYHERGNHENEYVLRLPMIPFELEFGQIAY